MIQSFRDLEVWSKSMDLTVQLYDCTKSFPQTERFGLTSQLRRAAASVPSNVAEGKAIGGQAYRRHIKIALGSNAELQTQIELALRLAVLDEDTANDLLRRAAEVGRMLSGLYKALPENRRMG